jgi:DNA-binding ferritin-like protein
MSKESKAAVVDALSALLASSYTRYLKTHNFH